MFDNDAPFRFASKHIFLGPICISLTMILGYWLSLGIHVSIVPAYVDIHFLWFVVTLQGKERGKFQEENENEWKEVYEEDGEQ